MSRIDTHLLEQYLDMLGEQGVRESMDTFKTLMPEYIKELEVVVAARDSSSVRRQAHKMKGACRSLAFVDLAIVMEGLEKDAWQWTDVDAVLKKWPIEMDQDFQLAMEWLAEHKVA